MVIQYSFSLLQSMYKFCWSPWFVWKDVNNDPGFYIDDWVRIYLLYWLRTDINRTDTRIMTPGSTFTLSTYCCFINNVGRGLILNLVAWIPIDWFGRFSHLIFSGVGCFTFTPGNNCLPVLDVQHLTLVRTDYCYIVIYHKSSDAIKVWRSLGKLI